MVEGSMAIHRNFWGTLCCGE